MTRRDRLSGFLRHARASAAEALAPREEISDTFYPQQPSCQIRNAWVLFETFLGQRTDGLFVEVGAYDGVSYSNTWGLATRGWRGLLIEPVPEYAAAAREAHSAHPGVTVVQCAIGAEDGVLELTTAGPFTSAVPGMIDEWESRSWRSRGEKVSVPMRTLDDVLAEFVPGMEIDVLVVDVEGHEVDVMAGFSWPTQPRLMFLELPDLHPSAWQRASSAVTVRDDLLSRGYQVAYKDVTNTVFVRPDVWERGWGTATA